MNQMIRTQIYLTPELYEQLRKRRERDGIAMAEQIREALRRYLEGEVDEEPVIGDEDPLWEIVGAGEGPVDGAEAHDRYLYCEDDG